MLSFYKESRELLSKGGFNLRSWISNNPKLREIAVNENTAEKSSDVKILGLKWNVDNDVLSLRDCIEFDNERSITKREILQQSSKVYDPLGVLSPVTVRAKILMQEIWSRQFDWDEPFPDDLCNKWHNLVQDLKQSLEIEIPRFLFHQSLSENENQTYSTETTQLHVFTDASLSAYGSCAYLVNGISSTLVMSKNRVAPLKQITLPRLELMGALLGARLAHHIEENIGNVKVYFWCDSQIVLSWIESTKTLKTFIANRVKEIKELFSDTKWNYCPTDSNPADLLTRGISADKYLQSELWTHGPQWILNKNKWPTWNGNIVTATKAENQSETEQTNVVHVNTEDIGIHRIVALERFSNLKKLLRVTACVYRFIHNCRSETSKRFVQYLTTAEIRQSLLVWIRNTQKTSMDITDYSIKRSSIVRQLKLFKDESDIFRCGGRIDNSSLSENTKHPYLLPAKHAFTNLVILDAHVNQLHSGVNHTVTHLRQSYWIPRIRQCVKTVSRKCVTCRKVTGKPYLKPDPPSLPKDRVDNPIPFSVTGVDFAGPLYVRNYDNVKVKTYLCLFTCATTRAVHLELVMDLTVDSFILAFRRFASRKSLPVIMISDNALTFVAASKEIDKLTKSTLLKEKLNSYGTEWKFIPGRAPWYGGFWERLIGLTKSTLKKILGVQCIHIETLQTVITEIESVLNDRPITYVSTDSNDVQPLTPSQLLCGRRITRLPYPSEVTDNSDDFLEETSYSLNQHKERQQELMKHFQSRWKCEYLTALREYHRTIGTNNQTIKVGDVVQIHDDSPRLTWKLGVIHELCEGKDGLTRSVKIRTKHGLTSRPIAKLYPLEVSDHTTPSPKIDERRAKTETRAKINQWTS